MKLKLLLILILAGGPGSFVLHAQQLQVISGFVTDSKGSP